MEHLYKDHRRILLIDANPHKLILRANILRNHEIEVHTAAGPGEAALFWRTIPYDLVLYAAPENSAETLAVTEEIRKNKPRQKIGLLVGPPAYIRVVGQPATKTTDRVKVLLPEVQSPMHTDEAVPQWREVVQRVVTDWYSNQAEILSSNGSAAHSQS